jgi:hypothetical protein
MQPFWKKKLWRLEAIYIYIYIYISFRKYKCFQTFRPLVLFLVAQSRMELNMQGFIRGNACERK